MNQAVTIIRQRVDASGVGEADVTTEGGTNIVVQIPGTADEQTRQRIEASAQLQLRAVLYAGQPATTFVGEDGKETPYPTPDPDARRRRRPRSRPTAATRRGSRPRCRPSSSPTTATTPTNDPANAPEGSAADHVRRGRQREVHPRSGRAGRLVDRRRDVRPPAEQRPVGGQPQLRRSPAPRPSARSASACTARTRRSTSSRSCSTATCCRRPR